PASLQHLTARNLPALARGTLRLLPCADLEQEPIAHSAAAKHGGVVVQGAIEADGDRRAVLDSLDPRLALMNRLRDPRILTRHRPVQVVRSEERRVGKEWRRERWTAE